MHTILGAGGVIGRGLALELRQYSNSLRLVGRHPHPVNGDEECVAADLLDSKQVESALRGTKVAYLVAGLEYNLRVWQQQWPVVMENVIHGCQRHGCRLVFFDNVYLYGRVDGAMTENTPINPCSKKGEVRAKIAERLMGAINKKELDGLIARSADFYGPGATNTFVHPMIFEKLSQEKKAAWLCNDHIPHSHTFTPDAARAVALLGNSDDAFGQVWHLPTAANPPTGREFIEMAAKAFGAKPAYQVLSPLMLRLAGLFMAPVRENMEMLYQTTAPYLFDSSKFNARFFQPTGYEDGIRAVVESFEK